MFLFLKFKCSATILLFARNKWVLNKSSTRIAKNLINAAAFNLINIRILNYNEELFISLSFTHLFQLSFNFTYGLIYFIFFWGMLFRYDNEFEKREINFKPRTKLNYSVSSRGVKTCETHE